MKKIIIAFIVIMGLSACEDLTKLDVNTKAATEVPSESLFANAQRNLVDFLATPSVNSNIFRMLAQHWTETTYIDEANYDLNTRNIPQNQWYTLYRDVLKDFEEAKRLVTEDKFTLDNVKKTQLAMIEVMEVYTWNILVSTFGNIPYSEALDFNILSPKYDDGATVMNNLITRLNTAITDLGSGGSADNFGDSDILYGGDRTSWIKFANSLKLKIGMTMADANSALAKSAVESAAAGVFSSNSDNAVFQYLSAPPNTNPIWVDLVQSGRKDFVVANTLVDKMNALSDPRVPTYFTTDASGTAYTGGIYGSNNNYATYSKPSVDIIDPAFPAVLLDYSEVEFLLAEAIERGYAVGGTAAGHYNNAITASMLSWGVAAADITTYLARTDVAYSTATGTYKQKIGEQKWIALFDRGFDAWTEWRRLDFPVLVAPPDALSAIPKRYTYPSSEQTINKANYESASSAIGGDVVTTKLFWDKN